jgi:flagellar hook-associated protein 3 FlgL
MAMRITNSMMANNYTRNLQRSYSRVNALQEQMTTNRRFTHISEDPSAFLAGQRARYALTRVADYQRSIDMAKSRLTQAEADLADLSDIAVSAYETAVDLANDTKETDDRQNVAEYIAQLRDHTLMTLNSIFGDKYAMGAYNTAGTHPSGEKTAPFTVDETTGHLLFNGIDVTEPANYAKIDAAMSEVITYDVGVSAEMGVAVNGAAAAIFSVEKDAGGNVIKVSNLYNTLDAFYNKLQDPACTGKELSEEYVAPFQEAQKKTLALTAEIGGKQKRLALLESKYGQDAINYTQMKSDAEDADEAELIMQFKMAETVYKAALAVGNYVLQPTLMDFIK